MNIDLMLMQISDSTLPIGAYAHSFGLETYVQRGLVVDEATTEAFVAHQIAGPLTYTELLGMRLAFELEQAGDVRALGRLDEEVAALRVPRELRQASLKLGGRFCRLALMLIDEGADASCGTRREPAGGGGASAERERFGDYADSGVPHPLNVAFGVFAAVAGMRLEEVLERYLFTQVSSQVTTAVKAVPLSQTSGQRIVRRSYPAQERAVRQALAASEDDLGRSSPGFDVRAIEHETLYSRLFMS